MAEKKKITRKVISSKLPRKEETLQQTSEQFTQVSREAKTNQSLPFSDEKRKRGCYFCQRQNSPSYTDLATLKKYLTDRVKILPRFRSALCAKHQREIAKNIKYARHLALLPFVPKV